MSTAGTDPELDRDIALARARVLRAPEDPEAALALADLLFSRGRPESLEEAARAYRRVIGLRPQHELAHARLVEVSARSGHYDRARAHLEAAERAGATVDPDLAALVRRLGGA
jgi:tetratricopeptide (TPR) repeat protein